MKKTLLLISVILFISMLSSGQSDLLEYGDAPEGTVAYPASGVIGAFPTCMNVAPGLYVRHNNFGAYFSSFDFETEGNAGFCPAFLPYDADECFADGDAGLLLPEPYTIVGDKVVTCPSSVGSSLGQPCQSVAWGQAIDTKVANFMPGDATAYVNVVIDWNQNGSWGDIVICPSGQVPEHVLVNFPVPNGFTGPLSALTPPPFISGDIQGFAWARLMVSEQMVVANWDGSGDFEDGESEDYLLYLGGYDFGDAPEGVLAYPSLGVAGAFPTCIGAGLNTYVKHIRGVAYFGSSGDSESDGNAGVCPVFTPNQYDQDECFQDGDAGLIVPTAFSITGNPGSEVVTPCSPPGSILDTTCKLAFWGPDIDIMVTGPGYVNVLMDWDQDGRWALTGSTICPIGGQIPEHVLVDFPIGPVTNVPLSTLAPSTFRVGPYGGYVWARFTVSDQPVGTDNWDGSGNFMDGESEDYLLEVYGSGVGIIEKKPSEGYVPFGIMPNPSSGRFSIDFTLQESRQVAVKLFTMQGSMVSGLFEGRLERGKHMIEFQAGSGSIPYLPAGIYILELTADNVSSSHERLVIRR